MQAQTSSKIDKFLRSAAWQRFLKLVGMLGSDADGERANASKMANDILRQHELTWGEVLGSGPAPSQGGQQTRIFDLESRLRLSQMAERTAKSAINELRHQLNTADKAIKRLERELMARPKTKPPHLIGWNIERDDFQKAFRITLNVDMRYIDDVVAALDLKIDERDPAKPDYRKFKKTEPKPTTRDYATELQRQINELVDEIEANVELNDWESQFCTSIRNIKYKISEKQVARLKLLAKQADVECDIEPVG